MTAKIEELLEQLRSKSYKAKRTHMEGLDWYRGREAHLRVDNFRRFIDMQVPVLFENDRFGFNRSVDTKGIGGPGNVTPNYYRVISEGFDKIQQDITDNIEKADDPKKVAFGKAMLDCIDIVLNYSDKYREYAREQGCMELYNALLTIPRKGATSFYEALVFMKLSIYFIRCSFQDHITLGRFDQYMYPFFVESRKNGVSDDELFEMLEEFFIALNYDTDLYRGIQQGDNGQSMVLGGFDKDGNSMYNPLSEMCMKASLELKLIDPKINLRVGKNTPDELFEFATQLTKAGLGFPQYCNDDVVVPGLVKLGYDYEDALNYSVAACWEFIVPNCGADVPNIHVMDFPRVVNQAIQEHLLNCDTFDDLMAKIKMAISCECDRLIDDWMDLVHPEAPILSMYFDGCIESLTDLFHNGTKYNNFGCHGTGIANATDALAAVKKTIYDDKTITKEGLLDALNQNFDGYTELRNKLRNAPKMGNNDDYADDISIEIMSAFADNMNGRDNGHKGIWRAGTGSAMEYIWKGEKCPATADGRKAGEPYSSSFSPSMDVKTTGLLSTIQSFTKFDFTNIINGGPLTIEIHDTVLRNDIGIKKTAMLVKEYINLGGHQLQLNSINRERLLDAQKHPEKYPELIVRVWGWSGYFNELDVKFQNHVIRRLEYSV